MNQRQLHNILTVLVVINCIVWLFIAIGNIQHVKVWYLDDFTSQRDKSEELALEKEQNRRQYLITKYCKSDPPGTASSIIIEPRSRVSYCLSRKISSTFWLQVLTYLDQNDKNTDLSKYTPFDIRKLDVQLRPKLKHHRLTDESQRKEIFNTTRFMFVRDPYSRLWSVFLDKFVIKDWWFLKRFGNVILKNKGVKVKPLMDVCSEEYNISFQEFLDFVVFWNNQTDGQMDDHFGTVINHCNPCKYKPHFVGKMETFETDSRHVLKLLKFEEFADVLRSVELPLKEMQILIDYNYYMFSQRFQHCVTRCVSRLLDAFMMNGYLSDASVNRLKNKLPMSKVSLVKEITHEYGLSKRTFQEISKQKRKWRIHAYRNVKKKTLLKIEEIFEKEAFMFNYDPFPSDIFNKKKS